MNWQEAWQRQFVTEADWLKIVRQQGLDTFLQHGLPQPKMEAWRYLRLKALERLEFMLPDPADVPAIVDNTTGTAATSPALFSFRGAAHQKKERFWGQWATLDHPFCALNEAFWQDGLFVEWAKGKTLQLGAVFPASRPLTMQHWRNWILLQEDAKAELFFHWQGQAEKNLTTTVSEIVLEKGAELILNFADTNVGFGFHPLFITVKEGARLQLNFLMMQGEISRHEITVQLEGSMANCNIAGFIWGEQKRQADMTLLIKHDAPQAISNAHIRALGRDQARVIVNGKIVVQPGAFQSEGRLEAHQLLLSKDAEIDVKPQLEIYNDDVQCSHGATVGKLDEEALFYLESRGMDRKSAEEILTYAFARAPFAEIPSLFRDELARALPATVMEDGHA